MIEDKQTLVHHPSLSGCSTGGGVLQLFFYGSKQGMDSCEMYYLIEQEQKGPEAKKRHPIASYKQLLIVTLPVDKSIDSDTGTVMNQ